MTQPSRAWRTSKAAPLAQAHVDPGVPRWGRLSAAASNSSGEMADMAGARYVRAALGMFHTARAIVLIISCRLATDVSSQHSNGLRPATAASIFVFTPTR